jgi:hypothetical protein
MKLAFNQPFFGQLINHVDEGASDPILPALSEDDVVDLTRALIVQQTIFMVEKVTTS